MFNKLNIWRRDGGGGNGGVSHIRAFVQVK